MCFILLLLLFLHIFHILNIILYYIPAICNFIWRGKYPTHLVLGRGKCPPTLSFGGGKCSPILFQGGANVRSSFQEGENVLPIVFGRDKCPGANVLHSPAHTPVHPSAPGPMHPRAVRSSAAPPPSPVSSYTCSS